ncbi:MAG: hypothetical protein JXQ73_17105 [Phycisphaerae bacterium]|nr:hypothetical protein [Phycisphaerae bacterium]
MSKALRSLLWKEWREQRWKVAFGCVILGGYTAIGLQTRLLPDETILLLGVFIAASSLPILASMDLVAAERAEGSLPVLLALPVRPSVTFVLKTAVGATTCAAPMLVAFILACLIAGGREISITRITHILLGGLGGALSFYVWAHCLGVRQSTEARSALLAIGCLAVMCGLILFGEALHRLWDVKALAQLPLLATPFAFCCVTYPPDAELLLHLAWIQTLLAVVLMTWAARRFARLGGTGA